MILNSNTMIFASNSPSKESHVSYTIDIEDDEALADIDIISKNNYIENGRAITETVYRKTDGTIITDILDVSAIAPLTKDGSDTVSRTRKIGGWGSIKLKAGFKWYTKGNFSYVKCTSMTASRDLDSKACVSKWEKDYTKDYVSIGKAKAQVEYSFYNSANPTQFQNGIFKITCSDSGTISDNG